MADEWLDDAAYRGLLSDVASNPDDDTPRLVMADWLEEHGHDDRARFIRLQIERAGLSPHSRRAWELRAEEAALLAANEDSWLGRLRRMLSSAEWRRGFVERASLGVAQMAKNAGDLFSLAPLRHLHILRLSQSNLGPDDLAKLEPLQRTRSLSLRGSGLADDALAAMLRAVGFPALEALDLTHSCAGDRTLAALESLALPRLRSLARFVPYDPRGTAAEPLRRLSGYRLEEIDLGGYLWQTSGLIDLAAWPGLASVRRLRLEGMGRVGPDGWLALLASPHLGPVEELRVSGSPLFSAQSAAALAARLGGLRALDLDGCFVGDAGAEALARSGLRRVEELRLSGNHLTARGVAMLSDWPGLASVRTLSLGSNPIGNQGLEALLASPHIGGLVSLDLSSTSLKKDAAPLLAGRGAMPHLAHLCLERSGLGQAGTAKVRASPRMAGVLSFGSAPAR